MFYGVQMMNTASYPRISDSDTTYIEYRFREGNLYSVYLRRYYDIFSVLSVCGGIYSSLFLIGFAFTIMFSYNLLMSSLIRKLYTFRVKFPQEMQIESSSDSDSQTKPGGFDNEDDF